MFQNVLTRKMKRIRRTVGKHVILSSRILKRIRNLLIRLPFSTTLRCQNNVFTKARSSKSLSSLLGFIFFERLALLYQIGFPCTCACIDLVSRCMACTENGRFCSQRTFRLVQWFWYLCWSGVIYCEKYLDLRASSLIKYYISRKCLSNIFQTKIQYMTLFFKNVFFMKT